MLTDCITCQNMSWCEQQERWDSGCINYRMMPTKNPTNAERIRSMSDEELATWINHMQADAYNRGMLEDWIVSYPNDYAKWLEWLRQDAQE